MDRFRFSFLSLLSVLLHFLGRTNGFAISFSADFVERFDVAETRFTQKAQRAVTTVCAERHECKIYVVWAAVKETGLLKKA